MNQINFDTKKINITPKYPVSMIGYFNNRVSEGILDPLFCRVLAISDGIQSLLFIQIDTCLLGYEFSKSLKRGISDNTNFKFENIMVFASHTHTGPALESFFEAREETNYKNWLKQQIINTSKLLKLERKGEIRYSRIHYDNLNSNRRWFMKDGSLITNPPKGSSDILKPEGPVDREMLLLIIEDEKSVPVSILVNISNHTDTIGGNLISADWPGFMEKRVITELDKDIMVIPAIAPAGNINHFDFFDPRNQTSYLEAERIGNRYGEIVLNGLKKSEKLEVDHLGCMYREVPIPSRDVDQDQIEEAKRQQNKQPEKPAPLKDLTAEDLAHGNEQIKYFFQKELLKYLHDKKPYYSVPLQVFFLYSPSGHNGPSSILSIPGEPFVEIGIELKKIEGYRFIMPISLANGYYGYIPLESHFKHGGYETLTTPSNCLSIKAGSIIIEEYKNMLETLTTKRASV